MFGQFVIERRFNYGKKFVILVVLVPTSTITVRGLLVVLLS